MAKKAPGCDSGAVGIVADAAVVGAGVIGSATAYELARRGWRVVVVDRMHAPGYGSTGASSAIVRFNYSTWEGVALSWEAMHCWTKWSDHLEGAGIDGRAQFCRTGFAMLDVPVAPAARVLPFFARAGIPHEVWDAQTLAAQVPGIDVGRYWPPKRLEDPAFWGDPVGALGAVFTPDAGYVDDPQLAAANLASAAERYDAHFLFNREVVEVCKRGDRISGLRLDTGEEVSAPVVVNVAGPWSSQVNTLAGAGSDFSVVVRPVRQEVHYVAAPSGYGAPGQGSGVIVADLDLGTYMRATPDGGFLIGGTEPACEPLEWLERPEDAHPYPTISSFTAQVTRAARRFPTLRVPGASRGIVGVYDVSSDWTPIYDRTDLPGFYVAMGTSGNQFKNAPTAGKLMAELIQRIENGHDHDRDPLRHVAEHTGLVIDLSAFSRLRQVNSASSQSVMG